MDFCLFQLGTHVRAEARRKTKYGSFRVVDSMTCARVDLGEYLPLWVAEVFESHIPRQAVLTSPIGGISDATN